MTGRTESAARPASRSTYLVTLDGREHRVEVADEGAMARVTVDGTAHTVDVRAPGPGLYSLLLDGRSVEAEVLEEEGALLVLVGGEAYRVELQDEARARRGVGQARGVAGRGPQQVTAPMPGKVVKLLVAVGDAVAAGQGVIVVEAMKMENELRAAAAGTVQSIPVEEGKTVNGGEVLVVIE
jgi:biotin carboxyl carrier protein